MRRISALWPNACWEYRWRNNCSVAGLHLLHNCSFHRGVSWGGNFTQIATNLRSDHLGTISICVVRALFWDSSFGDAVCCGWISTVTGCCCQPCRLLVWSRAASQALCLVNWRCDAVCHRGALRCLPLRDLLKAPRLIEVPRKCFSRINMRCADIAWLGYCVSPQEEGLPTLLWWWSCDLPQQLIFHIIKRWVIKDIFIDSTASCWVLSSLCYINPAMGW